LSDITGLLSPGGQIPLIGPDHRPVIQGGVTASGRRRPDVVRDKPLWRGEGWRQPALEPRLACDVAARGRAEVDDYEAVGRVDENVLQFQIEVEEAGIVDGRDPGVRATSRS
jgi:hypothetical protein